jgi:hypothetical protein
MLQDAPSDKCAYFRDINGIAAAFQYLQKNYSPAAMLFHWIWNGASYAVTYSCNSGGYVTDALFLQR